MLESSFAKATVRICRLNVYVEFFSGLFLSSPVLKRRYDAAYDLSPVSPVTATRDTRDAYHLPLEEIVVCWSITPIVPFPGLIQWSGWPCNRSCVKKKARNPYSRKMVPPPMLVSSSDSVQSAKWQLA